MTLGVGLAWDLLAKDQASPAFLRVAGAADKAATSTARASKSLAATTARMGTIGAALTKKLTLPLAGLAAVSVAQAAKYQKSLTTIQVVTDQTTRQMQKSGKGLLKIATETGTSLDQLTDGLYTVEKGGYRGAKALAIVRAAAQGAKAENVDLGTATDALTSIMASYGKALKDPIAAENLIIKGSGLAKTTMTDFANSLSNVVPVASSLHVSFAQVAAAIATMTQHGETAQHATDNLRNLITNLAGQNNVASQAMQQLGINTVNLSRNLGKRGLVGSLDYVLSKVSAVNHNGLIAVDAFKKSASATHDLQVELSHMPTRLSDISRKFASGHLDYKTYYTDVKNLGGQAFQMGKDFIGTFKQASGFNNLLKSGKPQVQTYASALQKMLGGVTGMNTALQLSGESSKRFHDDADKIADAAKNAGGDVLGWSKTQGTLSVKMDKAKASLQVLAVEIGTALIPAVSKIVDAVSKAVHWFDGLSSTDKKIIGWSAVVLAALGPIMSIGARLALVGSGIARFVGTASASLARLAFATEAQSVRIAASMRTITGALIGGAAGFGVGSFISGQVAGSSGYGGHTGKALLGLLGAAGGGAAAGGLLGGPIGAAVGGIAGTVSGVIGIFHHMGSAAQGTSAVIQAAMQENINWTNGFKEATDSLLGSLQAVHGAMNKQYKQQVISKLGDSGVLGAASSIGFSGKRVVSAALGNAKDTTAFLNALGRNGLRGVARNFLQVADAAGAAQKRYQLEAAAAGHSTVAHKDLGISLRKLRGALDTSNTYLKDNSAIAEKNRGVLQANVAQINQTAKAQLKQGTSADVVASHYERMIGTLVDNAHKLGFNRGEVVKLIASYGHVPKSVATELIKRGVLPADIEAIVSQYRQIPKTKHTTVTADVNSAIGDLNRLHQAILADSGTFVVRGSGVKGGATGFSNIPQGVSTVGERGWEMVVRKGNQVSVVPHGASRAATGWPARLPGFANGTSDKFKVTGGGLPAVTYSTKSAAEAEQANMVRKLNREMRALTGRYLPKFGKVLGKTGADVKTAFGQIRDTLKDLGVSRTVLHRLTREDNHLAHLVNVRNRDQARLNSLLAGRKAQIGSIRSATIGSFDIATAGTGPQGDQRPTFGRIYASALQDRNIVKKWAHGLRKLAKVFSKSPTGKRMLAKLATDGPGSWPQVQALLAANPKQLTNLVATERQIAGIGTSIGRFVGGVSYNDRIHGARATVRADERSVLREWRELRHDIHQLADRPIDVTVKVGEKVLATATATGAKKNARRGGKP